MMAAVLGAWRLISGLARSRIGRVVILVVLALISIAATYHVGRRAGVSAERAAQGERAAKGLKIAAAAAGKGAAITQDIRRDLDAKNVEIRWRTKTLKEEVPVYVPFEVDRAFSVPVGFVRLHDAAALGAALPAAASGPVDAPSGVTLSAVAGTIVDNYGACHVLEAEALAWRDWYSRQAALHGRYVKAVEASADPADP